MSNRKRVFIYSAIFCSSLGMAVLNAQTLTPTPWPDTLEVGPFYDHVVNNFIKIHGTIKKSEKLLTLKVPTVIFEGHDSIPYFPEGNWSITYDDNPWLEGAYRNGVMSGEWKLWEWGNTRKFIKADFLKLYNENMKKKKSEVFPYYLDIEGRQHDDIVIFADRNLLLLDGDSRKIIAAFENIADEDFRLLPDISRKPIWPGGPYCFWWHDDDYAYNFGAEEVTGNSRDFKHRWTVNVLMNKNIKSIFTKVFERREGEVSWDGYKYNTIISLKDTDQKGFMQLNVEGVVAQWDDQKKCFLETIPTPIFGRNNSLANANAFNCNGYIEHHGKKYYLKGFINIYGTWEIYRYVDVGEPSSGTVSPSKKRLVKQLK